MRLLLLNQFYPPDVAPTGQALHDLARVLASRGHEVHVLCSRRSYDGGGSYAAREELDGVQVHRLPALGFGRRGLPGKAADYASYLLLALPRALAGVPRPELLLALTTPPFVGLVAKVVARLRGAAHAHWIMDVYPDVMAAHRMTRPGGLAFRLLRGIARSELRGARSVVTLGPFMARRIEEALAPSAPPRWVPLWGEDPLAPWPSGTPNPARTAAGWGPGEIVLLYSGNMGLGHRFSEFLETARRLGPTGPRWAFAGGGVQRGAIEAFARSHPAARVELLPYVPRERLRERLASADVHLASLSTAWQGLILPSKVQAAFSVARPVIFVGPRDNEVSLWTAESGGGWVVAEDDVNGLLAAVEAARDPAERARRGEAALAYAREHFDRARNCERLARLLEERVSGP